MIWFPSIPRVEVLAALTGTAPELPVVGVVVVADPELTLAGAVATQTTTPTTTTATIPTVRSWVARERRTKCPHDRASPAKGFQRVDRLIGRAGPRAAGHRSSLSFPRAGSEAASSDPAPRREERTVDAAGPHGRADGVRPRAVPPGPRQPRPATMHPARGDPAPEGHLVCAPLPTMSPATPPTAERPTTSTPAGPNAVEVVDLVKRYPRAPVDSLAGVSFEVANGEIFGFLGPNGAGKTTTIGILTTRIRPTRGRAQVGGVDVVRDPVGARRVLGVVPQQNNLDRSLTVRQNLLFHASYHGVPRLRRNRLADELLEQFGLADRPGGRPDDFSGGQIQRMMIARALMHAPAVLFLDEPSTGLDPAARLFLWEKVAELRDGGTTVVITTHDMDEAATLSDRVAIIDHGTLLALDTPGALVRSMPSDRTLDCAVEPASASEPASVADAIASLAYVRQVEPLEERAGGGWRFRVYVEGEAASFVAPVAEAIGSAGGRLSDVALGEPNLEDVFIHLTGRALR